MYADLTNLCVPSGATLQEAALCMDRSRLGIVLVVDTERRLLGTITDGDMRRAMLAHVSLGDPVAVLLQQRCGSYARPITGRAGDDPMTHLRTLKDNRILHLPILDEKDRVVGLVRLDDFVPPGLGAVRAVIMAGGAGARLRPLTEDTPKPMLPIGDRPLMEIIIDQLRAAGIRRVAVTTHHKPEKISEHFGDGRDFGVDLQYVAEDRPLGTAGGLGLLDRPTDTTLVMNGDILTQVDLRAMLEFHRTHAAELTLAVRQFDLQIPYGIVECDGPSVRRLNEKPVMGVLLNAGIYLLEPSVYDLIPDGQRFDMTDLIQRLLEAGRSVVSFPVREYWLDIGHPEDYVRAQRDAREWGTPS
jgi:dTDP-glucose pyrophosphorylase/(2Fe-2S) ferredoxin